MTEKKNEKAEKNENVDGDLASVNSEEMLIKLEEATKRLNDASALMLQERALAEAVRANKLLDGVSEGGNKTKNVMSDEEYMQRVMAGERP